MFFRRRLRRRTWQNQPVPKPEPSPSYFDLELTADQLFSLGDQIDRSDPSEFDFHADAGDVKRDSRPR